MDWLFLLLDLGLFLLIVSACIILGLAAGVKLVSFLGTERPFLCYGLPLATALAAFVVGSRLAYFFVIANFPAGRWLNLLIVALLFPLAAPVVLEALRYSHRELKHSAKS